MKKLLLYCLLLTPLCLFLTGCSTGKKPNEIRVLYLGGQSDWQDGRYGTKSPFESEEAFQQTVNERMEAFGTLLRTYFDSVKVMRAADYTPDMSDGYDVTIFDGVPPVLEKARRVTDEKGNLVEYIKASYLPEEFSAASITIGSIGETIGRRYGSKNDWYCLCLDADAHGMNLEHPIFKGPFETSVSLTKQPTPEDALHYAYFQDEPVPDSVMMWKVNTKGYITDKDFNIGMVSRPWGYTDSPDCEVISSGVCAKTIDAVAIGRHANFLTWGFIGGPQYMTDEAKVVFANAVVYMAQHKGLPIARKFNDRISTREYLKEKIYLAKYSSYLERVKSDSIFYTENKIAYDKAMAKKKKGEELTGEDELTLRYSDGTIPPKMTYTEFLKRYQKGLFDQFGEDEQAYIRYYQENKPYIYGGKGMYELSLDEDAKAWRIPNNDIRLIEKAVECLEQGMEVERANRILERYTLCEFTQPGEWRNWFNKYKDKIFFTESGGWFFMVNEQGAPGNDYKALKRREAAKNAKVSADSGNALMEEPTEANPVIVLPQAKRIDDKTVEVKISFRILAGYHIYRNVASSDPYIALKLDFSLPEGCQLKGELTGAAAKPFGSNGTTIYEDNVTLTQLVSYTKLPEAVKCHVGFQCCNSQACLTPFEKEFTINVTK